MNVPMIRLRKQLLLISLFCFQGSFASAQIEPKAKQENEWSFSGIGGLMSLLKPLPTNNNHYASLGLQLELRNKKSQYSVQVRMIPNFDFNLGLGENEPAYMMEELNDLALAYHYRLASFHEVLNLSFGGGLLIGKALYRGSIVDSQLYSNSWSPIYRYDYQGKFLLGLNTGATIEVLYNQYCRLTFSSQVNFHQYREWSNLIGVKWIL